MYISIYNTHRLYIYIIYRSELIKSRLDIDVGHYWLKRCAIDPLLFDCQDGWRRHLFICLNEKTTPRRNFCHVKQPSHWKQIFYFYFIIFFFQNSGIQENRLFTYSLGSKCKRIIFNLDCKMYTTNFFVYSRPFASTDVFQARQHLGRWRLWCRPIKKFRMLFYCFLYIGYTTYTTTVGYTIQVCLSSLLYIALRLYSICAVAMVTPIQDSPAQSFAAHDLFNRKQTSIVRVI